MTRTLSFWKKVAAQAFEQTAFLARKRMLYSLGVGIAALVIQGEFGLHPWTNVAEIAASIIGAYILVTVLSFAWNLLRVPVIFYDDQQSTIKALGEVERTRQEASRNAKPFLWLSAASAPSQVLMVRRQHQGGGYSEGQVPVGSLTLTVENDCSGRISTVRLRISEASERVIDHRQLLSPGEKLSIDVTHAVLLAISGRQTAAGLPNLTEYGTHRVQMTLEYKDSFGKEYAETKLMSITIPVQDLNVQQILFQIDHD